MHEHQLKSWRVVGKRNISGQNHSYLRYSLWKKAEYIKGIAEKVANVEFNPNALKKLSNEEVIEKLKKLGEWEHAQLN